MFLTNMTEAPQLYHIESLNYHQQAIIKSSVPVLQDLGLTLTSSFYKYMLENYPEVRPFFNESNQTTLRQPKILAFALLNYAKCIDDLSPLSDFIQQIVTKHVGLQVTADLYPIVGISLITTMKNLLGEAANEDFMDAWSVAYGNLAQSLINLEWDVYCKQEWRGFREFLVTKIEEEATNVKSVYLTPRDGGKIAIPQRGQYLGFRFKIPEAEFEQSREYSISEFPRDNEYRISVRRVQNGRISNYINDCLKPGDVVKASPPVGRLVYNPGTNDLIVFTGGIGITPLISIVEQALSDGRNVEMFNSNTTNSTRPFDKWLQSLLSNKGFRLHDYVSEENRRLTSDDLKSLDTENKDVYLVGPPAYMTFVRKELSHKKVTIFLESFGPMFA